MGILVRFNGCLRGWTTAERNKMTNREKAIEDVAKEIGVGVDAVKQRLDNSWSIGGLGYVTAQRELVLDLRDALLEMEEIVAACYLVLRRHGLVAFYPFRCVGCRCMALPDSSIPAVEAPSLCPDCMEKKKDHPARPRSLKVTHPVGSVAWKEGSNQCELPSSNMMPQSNA